MCDMIGSDERDTLIAGLRSELAREQGKLRALQDIGQALGNTLDVEELVSVLLTRVSRIMDSERSTLFVVDDNTSELWTRFTHAGQTYEIRLKPGQGLSGWAAKWGRTVNVKDAYQDVRFDAEWDKRTGFRTRSTLCVPVTSRSTTKACSRRSPVRSASHSKTPSCSCRWSPRTWSCSRPRISSSKK